ncbi:MULTISPECIES: leucyl/phenylalanyl-tRNA--protein transferase [unclassified Colwellia]|uniref:leucyl/phenylalanyl-tRNA--protein transferase n=1 Tax=unclassified Colwellia TaxID=196834 RepID=UPI0015F565CD|nr:MULTISPECIES: leucyl/phenylalanyl-tRNA--protein transferase [unclassified Colwellia]MBA6225255.1 leucyl/phenylalanyl-tRNA--protein transferase [Colwellia sp. MB3u-45]MBA6266276.1 leucyl/phenylalanyl-tRNA--protein transferase [Colwellia sp. MB3u-43]MBA6288894.1 leucyl/phenylalanyl-tRNA--protein transferase [Colwellia sp. MB3u-4]MBA6322907.1 leucyl/phenylalanyl-tRNA--protein transferase [Colwellia sp. MB02u-19]MBA6324685.1 leucyl/phenylalanyl-tRNA--protein transferase [Colwellia sp. MB02u-18]
MKRAIPWLSSNSSTFPDLSSALDEPNGLLAFGDDLSPQRIIQAYQLGIFPWFSDGDPVMWWSPNPRGIINIAQLNINKTLQKILKRELFSVTLNKDFKQVIELCADAPFRCEETWIVNPMLSAYKKLHAQGKAHSIEVWQNEQLVGGLYGVAVNGYFSGESMFYRESNASKVALVYLASLLKSIGIELVDCQMLNPFLASMGCIEVSREQFITQQVAAKAIVPPANFWQPRPLTLA